MNSKFLKQNPRFNGLFSSTEIRPLQSPFGPKDDKENQEAVKGMFKKKQVRYTEYEVSKLRDKNCLPNPEKEKPKALKLTDQMNFEEDLRETCSPIALKEMDVQLQRLKWKMNEVMKKSQQFEGKVEPIKSTKAKRQVQRTEQKTKRPVVFPFKELNLDDI